MENYDQNITYGIHTIKVTFQLFEFKGFVTYEVGGNCKGAALLQVDPDDFYDKKIKENPIKLKDLGDDWYSMELTDISGDTCLIEDEWDCIGENIIGIELIDFVEE